MNKEQRLKAANEFIQVIANCGRNFLSSNSDMKKKELKPFVSYLELSPTGRVFFIDYYTKKRIYTHRKYCQWDGFTSGGTLKSLIEAIRDFITKGELMNAAYFQDRNHWGYGNDILIVRDAAIKLGLAHRG